MVPRLLTRDRKQTRVTYCQHLLNKCQSEIFLKPMVIVDEALVHHYDSKYKIVACNRKPQAPQHHPTSLLTRLVLVFPTSNDVTTSW